MKIFKLVNPKNVSIFKKSITQEEQISSIEAFNIWNALRARYISIDTYQLYKNFIHDRDFIYILNNHLKHFNQQAAILENLAKKFKIKTPERPPEQIKVSAHMDVMTDRLIFRKIFSDLLSELFLLSGTLTTSTLNDKLRLHFYKFVRSHIDDFEALYKYGKVKGWTDVEPSFKTFKPGTQEELATSEAGHIWDHINLRYDQLQLTQIFLGFVHDTEFKLILNHGIKTLQKQIKVLEKQAVSFEVPLPDKPPASQEISVDPEIMEDKFAYRIIIKGIQDAVDLHIKAIITTLRNDQLRKLFSDLFDEEMSQFNKLLRYGKTKGWTHVTPMYRK